MSNDLPLLGRAEELSDLKDAASSFASGKNVLVTIQGRHGYGITRLLDELASLLGSARKVELHPNDAHTPASLANRLELGDSVGGAVIVDGAQWADPTSLGMLQAAALEDASTLIALGSSDISAPQKGAVDRMAAAFRRNGSVYRIDLSPLTAEDLEQIASPEDAARLAAAAGGSALTLSQIIDGLEPHQNEGGRVTSLPDELVAPTLSARIADMPKEQRKVVEGVALAGRPVPLAVAAAIAGVDEDRMLDIGDALTTAGLLSQSAAGYTSPSPSQASDLTANLGEVRLGATYSTLADAFEAVGADPADVGSYRLAARDWGRALTPLAEAALGAMAANHEAEAAGLLDGAIEAYEESGTDDPPLLGKLRLARAKANRLVGRSELAREDAWAAIHLTDGIEQVEALEWAARLADDNQHTQESDAYLALAQERAAAIADDSQLASLHSLRARSLSRIGFPEESDASLQKAQAYLDRVEEEERFEALYDRAWVAFDQGRMRDAADEFDRLLTVTPESEAARRADLEAWLARALFFAGDPARAEKIRTAAIDRADQVGALGPVFLSHMALAEGGALYAAWDDALAGAREMLGVVVQSLPAWENAARYLMAQAHFGKGDLAEAASQIEKALEACPPGIDGWRWRNRCNVLKWRIEAAGGDPWPAEMAANLTEELLASRFYLQAAELLTARAEHERDPELGEHAAALALRTGVPMQAILATHAGEGWEDTEGAASAGAAKQLESTMPPEWRASWEDIPAVKAALATREVDATEVGEAASLLQGRLAEAFETAGLEVADDRLSPAQRQAAGMRIKRPRHVARRRRILTFAAALTVALVVSAGAVVAAVIIGGEGDTTIINNPGGPTTTATTVPLTPEEIELVAPNRLDWGLAQWSYRSTPDDIGTNVGLSDRSGVPEVEGFFWKFPTNDVIDASPIQQGRNLFIGSRSETFYGINVQDVGSSWSRDTDGAINAPASFASSSVGESGASEPIVFVGTDAGSVFAYQATTSAPLWSSDVGLGGVGPTFAVGDKVFALTQGGFVAALSVGSGEVVWTYPDAEESDLGAFDAPPAFADGILYVGTIDGRFAGIDVETGEETCRRNLGVGVTVAPVIDETTVYVGTEGQTVWKLSRGCQLVGTGTILLSEFDVSTSPIITDGFLYVASGPVMRKIDLVSGDEDFAVRAGATIRSSPVLADGIMYFGSDDGKLYAYDVEADEVLWTFQTDGAIRGAPVVADGVVYFASRDGVVYAVGAEPDGS